MKTKNWKLEIRNLSFIILFFFFFLFPSSILAQCTVEELKKDETVVEKIFTLFFGWLTKTDYSIKNTDTATRNKDMTEYGNVKDTSFSEKQAFAGSRSQNINNQKCLKGNAIKQTILNTPGYKNAELAQICLDGTCSIISIDDLANYFIKTNQKFYCDDNNNLVETESIIKEKISTIQDLADVSIPESKTSCYQAIYNQFYITPKDNTDDNEDNAKKIVRTVIPANSQDKNLGVKATKSQADKNFCPKGTTSCDLSKILRYKGSN